jgi:hypothetical protein
MAGEAAPGKEQTAVCGEWPGAVRKPAAGTAGRGEWVFSPCANCSRRLIRPYQTIAGAVARIECEKRHPHQTKSCAVVREVPVTDAGPR